MEAQLVELENKYNAMMAEVEALEGELANIVRMMEDFKKKLQTLSVKIDRGEQLVSGLSGEKIRWNATQHQLEDAFEKLVGDCLVASSFLCFVGPYPSDYRIEIGKQILKFVKESKILYTPTFNFSKFMTTDAQVREWQLKELPTDDFSTENAVLITKSNKWCTNIDPQGQCGRWLKAKLKKTMAKPIDFKDKDYPAKIEKACVKGQTVILQDIGEELDPTLVNIIAKAYIQIGRKKKVMVGDRELDWNSKF